MKTRKILALVLSLVMLLGVCGTAFAYHTTDAVTELETQNSDTSCEIAAQSYVLLENNGVLPIAKSGTVALFGSAAETTIKGGTGSGDVNQRAHDNIGDAFEAAGYTIANPTWFARMAAQAQPQGCFGNGPKTDLEITDAELAEAVAVTDTVIYAIARNAGEFSDREYASGDGSYTLTSTELANVAKISGAFNNVIVVYNTPVMDTGWQSEYNIDAVVYMGNGGQRGSEALVKVLNGEITPSGKLTDTWALQYSDYPSSAGFANNDGNTRTEWYSEGIYVGYRYFDTFGKQVKYPFGYGLSYTNFSIEVDDVTADAETVTVKATVANTGNKYSGKEVVQVYFSAPDGDLEKPYQELAAYGKTDELKPGEQQSLTLTFPTADLSSYSEAKAAYVIEPGDYIIRVGNSSRNTKAVAVIDVDAEAITEQMYNQLALEDGAVLNELRKGNAAHILNNDIAELPDAIKISLKAADIPTVDLRPNINDDEDITIYMFAEDAANYQPKEITLTTKTVAGIINNAQNPNGPSYNGHSTTTYKEIVEVVDPLPEGITKANAKLTDVFEGRISLNQFLACLSTNELSRIAVGGASGVEQPPEGAQVGAQASAVNGGAGQTTDQYYLTRHIPSMPNADGPAGIRITQSYELPASSSSSSSNTNQNQEFTVNGSGRYVRITLRNPATNYGFSIYEFEIYSGNTNVALNKPATAKTEGTYNNPPFTANLAFDGDFSANSRWGSNWSGGDTQTSWLQVDLGQVYNIQRITVAFDGAYANAYDIEVSNDGTNYTNLVAYVNGAGSSEPTRAYQFCTAFPVGTNIAQTWDIDVIESFGKAVGSEMIEYGVTTWLAPGMDMHRNPLNGRNFEYYSEDPLVAGLTAAYTTKGVQSYPGIGVTLKHFFGNEQESNRNELNNVISERAAREIYLKQFEIAVKLAQPQCMMNCYNENNGWPGSDSWDLNEDILRGEWGFGGAVMTDWGGGQSSPHISMHAGCDMIMSGGDSSLRSVRNGNMSTGDLQKAAGKVLTNALISQDMVKLYADVLGKEVEIPTVSADRNAPLANGYTIVEKGPIQKADIDKEGLVTDVVEVNAIEADSVSVGVAYTGEGELGVVRLVINSELPIDSIGSVNAFEFNPETNEIIVYSTDGKAISNNLFTLNYKIDEFIPDGEYEISNEIVEIIDPQGNAPEIFSFDGAVIVNNVYPKGDISKDGQVTNADLILIARYLVHLIEFDEKQMEAADYNDDGVINNTDLVLIARAVVSQ